MADMQTMVSAKEILVKPIRAAVANEIVKRIHYSGKIVNNSQLHLGVFLNGKLEVPCSSVSDKRKIKGWLKRPHGTGSLN